jgi:uncharacterized protein (DUF2141 family)
MQLPPPVPEVRPRLTRKVLGRTIAALASITTGLAGFGSSMAQAGVNQTFPKVTITKTEDGQAPFDAAAGPGNDTAIDNNEVRAGQLTKYQLAFNILDATAQVPENRDNVTFTADPLPLGVVWDKVPGSCSGAGSMIAGDGITTPSVLVCNMGTWLTGSAWVVNANVRALPTAADNTTFHASGTVSAASVPNTGTATSPDVKVRTQPRIDLVKNAPYFFGSKSVGGQPGFVYGYGMGIKYRPGSEVVATPITWSDDLALVHPAAQFLGCAVAGFNEPVSGMNVWAYGQPYGKFGAGAWTGYVNNTKERSVADSGTITCTPGAGQNVAVSVAGIDTNPTFYPSMDFAAPSAALTPGDNWIGSYVMTIWIPATAFNSANSFNFIAENHLNDFAPVGGVSGNANFGDATLEPGRGKTNEDLAGQSAYVGTQDWYKSILYRPNPGSFDKIDFAFADGMTPATFNGDTTNGTTWAGYIGSGYKTGDGVLAASNKYTALNELYFTGVIDMPAGLINCMTIDNRYTSVEPLPGHPTRGGYVWSGTPSEVNAHAGWVVEYGTGGLAGAGTTWASNTDRQQGTCDDADSATAWTSDLSTISPLSSITKIRARTTRTYTVAEQLADIALPSSYSQSYNRLAVLLKVQNSAPGGAVAANYQTVKDPSSNWFTGWYKPTYDETTGLGYLGDRITVVGTRVRTAKSIAQTTYRAGAQQDWTLANTSDALSITPAGQAQNVTLVDTIPTELSYVAGSAVCTAAVAMPTSCEPTVVNNGNGTQTITWNFGTFTAGSTMSTITFKTDSESVIQDGASRVNQAVISADNDNSPESFRVAKATANFANPAAFNASKRVMTPLVEKGDPITYRLTYGNTSPEAKLTSDFIDWLPHNGDPRTPATVHDGTMEFVSLTKLSGLQATSVQYSKEPYASLVAPIPGGSEGDYRPSTMRGAIVWCATFSGGACPASAAEVTGFRITGAGIDPGQKVVFELTMKPKASDLDKVGNLFTNRFMGDVQGIPLAIESNNVTARVVGSSIGDTYFHDLNKNGVQNAGEPGIAGVNVKLFDNTGVEVPVGPDGLLGTADDALGGMTTDANGKYLFANLRSGNYSVGFGLPAGYSRTAPGVGTDRALDSDAGLVDGKTATVSVGLNANRTDIDAGVWQLAKLSGHVYVDPNQDASHGTGANDRPLAGIKVTLTGTDVDGNPVNTFVFTDANGFYEFTGLVPGTYEVSEGTVSDATLNDAADVAGSKGGTVTNEKVSAITINSGDNATNYDFTEVEAPASLAGSVKVNGTGAPIANVTIKATNTVTSQVFTTTTDATGNYSFPSLPAGTYNVAETQPAGYNDATDSVGTGATTAGTAGNDLLSGVVLKPRDAAINYDFTETVAPIPPASLAGSVKVNGTGAPIANVTIKLTNTVTGAVFTTTTDANGAYSFTGLTPGTYSLAETQPAGYNDSTDSVGTGATTAGTGSNDAVAGIVLASGDAAVNYDFTETKIPPASLAGSVKVDGTGAPIANVTITLTNTVTGDVFTTTTDAAGKYAFTNLTPGTYSVKETQPLAYLDGPDSLGTGAATAGTLANDEFTSVVLAGGDAAVNYDFTETKPASIAGAVYVNGTNTQIAGVSIKLTNTVTGASQTTTTGTDGKYSFTNLPAGTYTVSETQPAGFDDSGDKLGTGATGAAGTLGNDSLASIGLVAGDVAIDYDFTEIPTPTPQPTFASFAGQVYVAGTGRPIPGTKVTLTGVTAGGVTTTYTTTTDANGAYFFGDLPAGTYRVVESQPSGYDDAADLVGTKGGTGGNDETSAIVLVGGDAATGYDFTELVSQVVPVQQPVSVSGRVFVTDDNSPIAGVVVRLTGTDINGVRVELTAITDANGKYTFNVVPSNPAGYTIRQEQPAGYVDNADVAGSGGGVVGNDVITNVVVSSGTSIMGYDFSESRPVAPRITPTQVIPTPAVAPNPVAPDNVTPTPTAPAAPAAAPVAPAVPATKPATKPVVETPADAAPAPIKGGITGVVYLDNDRSQLKGSNELGRPGVTVNLLDSNGKVLQTVTSDERGVFTFKTAPGEYTIEIVPPAELGATTPIRRGVTVLGESVDGPVASFGLVARPAELALTGGHIASMLQAASVLLLAGLGLSSVRRRKLKK